MPKLRLVQGVASKTKLRPRRYYAQLRYPRGMEAVAYGWGDTPGEAIVSLIQQARAWPSAKLRDEALSAVLCRPGPRNLAQDSMLAAAGQGNDASTEDLADELRALSADDWRVVVTQSASIGTSDPVAPHRPVLVSKSLGRLIRALADLVAQDRKNHRDGIDSDSWRQVVVKSVPSRR